MTQVKTIDIECRHCHKSGKFEVLCFIDVETNPELREKIMNEGLFFYQCPYCCEEIMVPFPFIYHDVRNHFMIFFDHSEPAEGKYEDVDIPADDIESFENHTFRAVYGLENLKEKIILLERGLDDIAVERLKFTAKHIILPELERKNIDIFTERITGPSDEHKYGTIHFYGMDPETGKEGHTWFKMQEYYEQEYACKFDPRMKAVGKCPCIDAEWMERKLRNI